MVHYNQALLALFTRDLNKLKEELSLYANESAIWKVDQHVTNSAGTLTLHLLGNLNHFIGATLGYTEYIRDREAEFSERDIPRHKLIDDIDNTIGVLIDVFGGLSGADMEKGYPLQIQGKKDTTGNMLLHLFGHLSYHLGQINYHRRLLDK
jgi:hypothetical protein